MKYSEVITTSKIKDRKDWDTRISYDCGCEIIMVDEKAESPTWRVDWFCDDHDPTIERDEWGNPIED